MSIKKRRIQIQVPQPFHARMQELADSLDMRVSCLATGALESGMLGVAAEAHGRRDLHDDAKARARAVIANKRIAMLE